MLDIIKGMLNNALVPVRNTTLMLDFLQ